MAHIRTIKYLPKSTNARTQYVDLDHDDMAWLKTELIRWIALMGELDGSHNDDVKQIMKYWWYKKSNTLPKGKEGQNSPLTFVSGLVNNLVFGTTQDLTMKYLDSIENISSNIVLFEEAMSDDLNTLSQDKKLEKIKFVIALLQFKIP